MSPEVMRGPVGISILAAVCVVAAQALVHGAAIERLGSAPLLILVTTGVAVALQRLVLDRGGGGSFYDGLADLFLQIHAPAQARAYLHLAVRGAISFLLAVLTGMAGPEGAAIELTFAYALRVRSRAAQWFERRRRTDAAIAVASGISAAFAAPLSGILLTLELGMGGDLLKVARGSVLAFALSAALRFLLEVPGFDAGTAGTRIDPWSGSVWAAVLIVAGICGITGALLARGYRLFQNAFLRLIRSTNWMRILLGGSLLMGVAAIYPAADVSPVGLLGQVLSGRRLPWDVLSLFVVKGLGMVLILSTFGSTGFFWPLFAIGGLLGVSIDTWFLRSMSPSIFALSGLIGAATFWASVLGTPLTGAVLAFELTGNPGVLLPAFAGVWIAREISRFMGTVPLADRDLAERGVPLLEGRLLSVLDALRVKDAMVTDFDVIQEGESVASLSGRLLKLSHPFLPVVNSQGLYSGLLTVDLVQEAALRSREAPVLEVKDLFYRNRIDIRTVKPNDRLTVTAGLFEESPCVPVISDDGRVAGLLFADDVRAVYDREAARRSLGMESRA